MTPSAGLTIWFHDLANTQELTNIAFINRKLTFCVVSMFEEWNGGDRSPVSMKVGAAIITPACWDKIRWVQTYIKGYQTFLMGTLEKGLVRLLPCKRNVYDYTLGLISLANS
jgi:hypothetical protein